MKRLALAGLALAFAAHAAAPSGQYTVGVDTVTDTRTTLVWQRATAPGTYTWTGAISYCEALSLAGQTDWRLPTVKELNSILDERATPPKIDPQAFPSTPATVFFSSTPHPSGGGYVLYVSFQNGYTQYASPTTTYSVRCVRGG